MIRTQIQLTPEQARDLKRMAAKEKKSISKLIRLSIDAMIHSKGMFSQNDLRQRAIAVAGQLRGPETLAANHDDFLSEAYGQ
ncbi:MAG: CopG family transcriptional regulator [Leptolinea sp.]